MRPVRCFTCILAVMLCVVIAARVSGQAPAPAGGTIGDVIAAKKSADAQAAQATDAARAANEALTTALEAQQQAGAGLKAGLAAIGPVFIFDQQAGTIEVWIPDASDQGYNVIRPAPVTTAVPAGGGGGVAAGAPVPSPQAAGMRFRFVPEPRKVGR
jgi:hypothetical protein